MAAKAIKALVWTVALCGATFLANAASSSNPGFQFKPWPRNQAVPALVGIDLNGNSWNLKTLRGQPVLVNFWASWCEPCRAEMPSLQALAEQQSVGLSETKPPSGKSRVLAVNFKESPAAVQRFVNQTQLRLPVVLDSDGAMAKQWGVSIFPSTVLIGADGKVRGTVVGELDWTSGAAQPVLRRLNRE
jgi:thiol-disulfide isomerase/thioredoxin